jgi:hypothetical protein
MAGRSPRFDATLAAVSLVDVHNGRVTALARRESQIRGAWSADSKRFALVHGGDGIDVFDVATRRYARIPPTGSDCADPDWSADGWVLCWAYHGEEDPERRGTSDLLVTKISTGARVTLSHEPTPSDLDARWAPLPG